MQVKFIESVMDLYESGENRALLISSTGTGKTYASAFALREMLQKPGKGDRVEMLEHFFGT